MARISRNPDDFPAITKNSTLQSPGPFTNGAIILMDKPLGWSSFDVVKYVRYRVPPKKVGHAGTLDPLATGLLLVCTGKATKTISAIQDMGKTYQAELTLGAATPSFDADTKPDQTSDYSHVTEEAVQKVIAEKFTGKIEQVAPVYSAKRYGGKRLYEYARKGQEVHIEASDVFIKQVTIDEFNPPLVRLTVECGKGTYIRSLAHDLGIALGTHAHLAGLRRTATGPYLVKDALTPEAFNQRMKQDNHG